MNRSRVIGALAAAGASLAITTPAVAASHRDGGALIPTRAGETLPTHGGTATSANWAGYAVTPASGGITAVNSTFTVPSAGIVPPGFAATWAGIGGYNTSDLIQAGVSENSLPSNPLLGDQYYPWYEILPASETQIDEPVTPGDQVTVNIYNVSGNTWEIQMTDAGKWTWSKQLTYASSESSAEWILEAPTVAVQSILASVGTTSFTPANTYVAGGRTYTVGQGDPTTIDAAVLGVGGLLNEATPSALASDGQTFNVCAYTNSCATP